MVAEQTAAYQKQMWLSQLQVTNPQAYQVTLLFMSWYHLHPWVLWNYFSQPFAPFLEPVPEGVTSVNEFSVPAPESKDSVPAPNLNIQFLHQFVWEADELALFSANLSLLFNPVTRTKNLPYQHNLLIVALLIFIFYFGQVNWVWFHLVRKRGHLNHDFGRKMLDWKIMIFFIMIFL